LAENFSLSQRADQSRALAIAVLIGTNSILETKEMSHPTLKSLALLAAISGLALCLQAQTPDAAKDPMSRLPLHPGLTARNEPMRVTICKKQAQVNQYQLPFSIQETISDGVAWFKVQLPGYRYYHTTWNDRPQELFYSPDGTKGVNVIGTPTTDKVFQISYLVIQPGLTEHEIAAFSPANPSCR
jgi:hypothetical protein